MNWGYLDFTALVSPRNYGVRAMSSSIEKSVPESCMPALDGLEVSSLVDAIGPIESCVYQIHVSTWSCF